MLDILVADFRNQDGMFYRIVDSVSHKIVDEDLADVWGYVAGAYYIEYAIHGDRRFVDPILKLMGNLDKVDKVSKADIRRVANKAFQESNRTIGTIETVSEPAPAGKGAN